MKEIVSNRKKVFLWQSGAPILYAQTIAESLIAYADRNEAFAKHFELLIRKFFSVYEEDKVQVIVPIFPKEKIDIIMPEDEQSAIRRSEWFLARVREKEIAGALEAEQVMKEWVRDREWESPKQIVVGFVVVAIPGITMGKFSKKRSRMSVLIRNDVVQGTTAIPRTELTEKVSAAGQGVIFKTLIAAKGDLQKIPPETFEWFSGDRKQRFLKADRQQILRVKEELRDLRVINSAIFDEKGIAMVAMSPEVNESYFSDFETV